MAGVFGFLAHGASMLFFPTVAALRPLRPVAWLLNYVFLVRGLGVLDSAIGLASVYPTSYVVLARRRAAAGEG